MSRRLTAANTTEEETPDICDKGGSGLLLPFASAENDLPKAPRAFAYLILLAWCFLGVSIIADIFMGAIEAVTSSRKKVTLTGGRIITVKVWNDTVANLTLMALGSSAPEILLNVLEILGAEFKAGELGPGTIVGSAAFNLLVIIAVCVYVIPEGEKRTIKQMPVFLITAASSVLAYFWLIIILSMSSPDCIEPWEGIVTFLLFPVLVVFAYLADIGKLNCKGSAVKNEDELNELAEKHALTPAEMKKVVKAENQALKRGPSRAARRMEATAGSKPQAVQTAGDLSVGFLSSNDSHIKQGTKVYALTVQKYGKDADKKRVALHYKISRQSEDDELDAFLELPAGAKSGKIEITKVREKVGEEIFVSIIDAVLLQPKTEFVLAEGYSEGSYPNLVVMPDLKIAKAVVVDENSAMGTGKLMFAAPTVEHRPQAAAMTTLTVKVMRFDGSEGQITCLYKTKAGSARPKSDYVETEGKLIFGNEVMEMEIKVQITEKPNWERADEFYVDILDEDLPGDDDLGVVAADGKTCTVTILETDASHDVTAQVGRMLDGALNLDAFAEGNTEWYEQIRAALRPVAGDEDDAKEASAKDWTLHIIALPWKLLFALVPPPQYCGGWVCFVMALIFIGGVTALIGDLANLMGCCMGLPSGITAITIVALGTSLPDTFASKVAAVEDPSADAAIGNVTGSNSVNVFLGLGLPWMIASLYWDSAGPTEQWKKWYPELSKTYPDGGFIVKAGDLTFSVSIFICCACTCLFTIGWRRRAFAAELGGPSGVKMNTSIFFVLLWLLYVGCASWKMIVGDDGGVEMQIAVVCLAIAILVCLQFFIAFIMNWVSSAKATHEQRQKDMADTLIAHIDKANGGSSMRRSMMQLTQRGAPTGGSLGAIQAIRKTLDDLKVIVDDLEVQVKTDQRSGAARINDAEKASEEAPAPKAKAKGAKKTRSSTEDGGDAKATVTNTGAKPNKGKPTKTTTTKMLAEDTTADNSTNGTQ